MMWTTNERLKVMTTLKRICLVAMVTISATATVQALPAGAIVADTGAIRQFQSRRDGLKARETNLLRDYDEIQKQIDYLNGKNDRSLDRRIDDLNRSLDNKYADLQRVRQDLRDVEVKML